MPDKIKNARICLLINGWLSAVATFFIAVFFLILSLAMGASDDPDAATGAVLIFILGFICSLLYVAVTVLSFMTAKGVKEKKNWAKIAGIIIAVLGITNIPIGTVLGIFILIGLLDESATKWFSAKPAPAEPAPTPADNSSVPPAV